eukprot:5925543-Amphidinium_carterae.1
MVEEVQLQLCKFELHIVVLLASLTIHIKALCKVLMCVRLQDIVRENEPATHMFVVMRST